MRSAPSEATGAAATFASALRGAATSERVIAKSQMVEEQHMEIASSESEVGASADICVETDAVSEIWYVLGTVLIYGGGVGLVAYFLLM